jgi:hypothetical protein
MLSDSMITWLMPTISPGMALGTRMRQVICRFEQPVMRPSSCDSSGTALRASSEIRVIGGRA